jgi:ATP-dependent Lhr-like helicase
MRGYLKSLAKGAPSETLRITDDLFKILRGKNNLVFANSRNNTESYAYNLSEKCREKKVPNEFFPHHGSLSREIREDLEKRLQENKVPTTAVCTMTLELGIDIGHVDSIAQLAPPQSIASLRQRLGRSGRRGKAAVLRFFITELKLDSQKHITDMLRLNIFQIVSMVNLLLEKWYEPPNTNQYHFSTLIQQTLSVIGQYGGVMANQLWELLCGSGPFEKVSVREYEDILRALGKHNLITQSQDGTLIIGDKGEQLVSNYTFYSAFNTPEEYTLETSGKTLGTLPIVSPLSIGEHLVFAGKRWEIIKVFQESKHIVLKASTSGEAPNFSGNNQMLHDRIREEMLKAYLDGNMPVYLNNAAQNLFNEGLQTFNDLKLKDSSMIEYRDTLYLFPWKGDRTTHAISCILRLRKIDAETHNGVIEIKSCDRASFLKLLRKILRQDRPGPAELVSVVLDTVIEKYDRYVPYELNALDYASKMFDIDKAWQWLNDLVRDN